MWGSTRLLRYSCWAGLGPEESQTLLENDPEGAQPAPSRRPGILNYSHSATSLGRQAGGPTSGHDLPQDIPNLWLPTVFVQFMQNHIFTVSETPPFSWNRVFHFPRRGFHTFGRGRGSRPPDPRIASDRASVSFFHCFSTYVLIPARIQGGYKCPRSEIGSELNLGGPRLPRLPGLGAAAPEDPRKCWSLGDGSSPPTQEVWGNSPGFSSGPVSDRGRLQPPWDLGIRPVLLSAPIWHLWDKSYRNDDIGHSWGFVTESVCARSKEVPAGTC